MSDWPVTDRMKPRPVYLRYVRRRNGFPLDPPSDAEKSDAIRLLAEPYMWADEVGDEAFRIFMEASEEYDDPDFWAEERRRVESTFG